MRAQLEDARQRKASLERSHTQATRQKHDEILSWKVESTLQEEEAKQSTWGLLAW